MIQKWLERGRLLKGVVWLHLLESRRFMQTKKWKNVLGRNQAFHHLFESKTCSSPSKCYFCIVLNNSISRYEAWQELITVVLPSTSPVKRRRPFLEFPLGNIIFPSSRVEFCLPIACVISYSRMKLFRLIFALQLGKTERHSWLYTSAPITESSWVPYIIARWLFSESLFGQRAGERWKQQHKENFYQHFPLNFKG